MPIRGERGHHRRQAFKGAQPNAGNLQGELYLGQLSHGFNDFAPQLFGGADEPIKQLRAGMIGNHIGGAPAFDDSDIQGARTDFRVRWQLHRT